MKVLELFCGTKSFSKVAEARGHECRTLDNDPRFEPTYCMDILDFEPDTLGDWRPDIIWASPPCQCFSVASIPTHWERIGHLKRPKSEAAKEAIRMVEHTVTVIKILDPRFYFIENPMGKMRTLGVMRGLPRRRTVTYCQYGDRAMKPTDIWTNYYGWVPKPKCSPLDDCHDRAPRGSKVGGTQGKKGATERAIVPAQLCEEIIIACEKVRPKRIVINPKPHKSTVSKIIGEIILEEKVKDGGCDGSDSARTIRSKVR